MLAAQHGCWAAGVGTSSLDEEGSLSADKHFPRMGHGQGAAVYRQRAFFRDILIFLCKVWGCLHEALKHPTHAAPGTAVQPQQRAPGMQRRPRRRRRPGSRSEAPPAGLPGRSTCPGWPVHSCSAAAAHPAVVHRTVQWVAYTARCTAVPFQKCSGQQHRNPPAVAAQQEDEEGGSGVEEDVLQVEQHSKEQSRQEVPLLRRGHQA